MVEKLKPEESMPQKDQVNWILDSLKDAYT